MIRPVCVPLAVLLFALCAAGLSAQNVEITVERADSRIYSGFRERIYIDGRSRLTLANGASGKISIPAGEHTIYAELYTIKTGTLRFNAAPGVKFVVTPHSLDNFVVERSGGVEIAAAAANRAAQVMDQAMEEPPPRSRPADNSVEATLERAADTLINKIPPKSKIAIVYVTARDPELSEFIFGELEFIMVGKGYTLIDRSELDRIRQEQKLQMSGEVDDNQAVSIGKFVGADVIITGAVTGSGDLRRLRLRALSTESAAVLSVASERY
jgi:hypothetical protein